MTVASSIPLKDQQHCVLDGVSWELYEQLLANPGGRQLRITYDNGELEMMAPLAVHELWKKRISRLIELMAIDLRITVVPLGAATFRRKDLAKGLELDECYYVRNAKDVLEKTEWDLEVDPPPDLAIEIDITHRSVPREPIYAALTVNVNGREWLSRQMDAAGVGYRRADNCFTAVEDPAAAQRLLDRQVRFDFAAGLGRLAAQVNPALRAIVGGYDIGYYWSLDQSEWATDVLFRSREELGRLYPGLVRHGIESFGSKDVMRFLGRSVERGITPRFAGEVVSDLKGRPEGMRIKHRVNLNSVKMYDKAGCVLRVETTLNDVHDLQSPRLVNGKKVWKRMRKGVADVPERARVSQASNGRYLEALAAVATPLPLKSLTDELSRPVRWKKQQVRGLNCWGGTTRHCWRRSAAASS